MAELKKYAKYANFLSVQSPGLDFVITAHFAKSAVLTHASKFTFLKCERALSMLNLDELKFTIILHCNLVRVPLLYQVTRMERYTWPRERIQIGCKLIGASNSTC